MTLNRQEAADELANRAGRHLLAVGLTADDTTGNLKEPLDDTFRALGVAYADVADAEVEESELDRFLAVGAVFVLRQALGASSGFADVAATALGTSKRKSQIVKNLMDQLNRAESYAAQYGVAGLTAVMASGVVILDVLEPEEVNA
jgi:hypothetical protein